MNRVSTEIGALPRSGIFDRLPIGGYRLHFYLYFLDLATLTLISLTFYILPHIDDSTSLWLRHGIAVAIAMLVYSIFAFSNGMYDWRRFRHNLNNSYLAFGSVLFTFGTLLLIAFIFKISSDFSRLWLLSWFGGFCVYVLVSRVILAWFLSQPSRKDLFRRRAVILGGGKNGQEVLDHIVRFDGQDIFVIGFVDDRTTRAPLTDHNVPLLGGTAMIEQMVRERCVDLVIMALPWEAFDRINFLSQRLSSLGVDVYMAPDKLALHYADRPIYRFGGMPLLSLQDQPISEWNAVIKRIEDLCIVIPALILLSPLLAIVAIAIKLESKGDVFFIQERFGLNNEIIKVYKFRSMYTDMSDCHGRQQTIRNDPRVTRVGRVIRKTSFDELPQLVNVLLGNMSIVGPRPHPTGMQSDGHLLHDVLRDYASRHRVKPGLTGWAQCNGWRGETDTREKIVKRVEYDLYYIENWSVFLDLLTILKTVLLLFKSQERAY